MGTRICMQVGLGSGELVFAESLVSRRNHKYTTSSPTSASIYTAPTSSFKYTTSFPFQSPLFSCPSHTSQLVNSSASIFPIKEN